MTIRTCFAAILIFCLYGISATAHTLPFAFWKTPPVGGGCPGGGFLYSGSCYYLSTAGDSCITTCASLGGCLLNPMKTVSVDNVKCSSVLTSLGVTPGSLVTGFGDKPYACSGTGSNYTIDYTTVTCGASAASQQRVCACGAGGLTQTGVGTVDGYNYRAGAVGASCDTACASYGGCVLAGVTNANTSNAKCDQILAALDFAYTGSGSGSTAAGCGFQTGGYRYRGSSATCAGTVANVQRACACANP